MKGRNQYILYLINIIVFILLETVALRLISHNSVLQRTEIIKSVSAVTNAFSGGAGNIGRYFSLGSLNRKLAEENVALRRENDRLRAALADVSVPDSVRTESPLFDYIPALVVSNSTDRLHNVLIINKGRRDGVREDMGVVTDRGLVGYIQSVSEKYSKVSSLLDIDNMASATLTRTNTFGVLQWDGRSVHKSILHDIPVHTELLEGDTVVSSGYSLIYPPGIPIGMVSGKVLRDGVNYDLTIDLFEEFSRLRHVYVAVRKDIGELETLAGNEDSTEEGEGGEKQ